MGGWFSRLSVFRETLNEGKFHTETKEYGVSLSNPCLRWRLLVAQRSVSRARFPVVMQCSLLINSYVLRHAVFLMCYKPESPKAVLRQDVYIFLHGCFLVMPIYSY